MGKSLIIKGADFSEIAIPKEYVVLDWIANDSNGSTHFDTGVKPDLNKRFELGFSLSNDILDMTNNSPLVLYGCANSYGNYTANNGLIMGIRKYSTPTINNTIQMVGSTNYFGEQLNRGANGKITDDGVHVLSVCPTEILLDGVQAMDGQPTGGTLETPITNNIYLCGVSGIPTFYLKPLDGISGPGYYLIKSVHTHSFKIFANKTDTAPSMNFVPVLRNEDRKPYFYDTVNAEYVPASNNGAGLIYALNGIIYNYDGSEYSE
jgi:hypothetical protein